jgi:hypothetical protein
MALAGIRKRLVSLWYITECVTLLGLGWENAIVVPRVAAAGPSAVLSQEGPLYPQARAFALKDQYDTTLVYDFPRETMSVLFVADYAGSGQLEAWIRPLYDRYQKSIGMYGVADLSAVPGFMRGLVTRVFRTQFQYPVMFDWHGTVSRSYEAQSGQANLYLIDTQGRIVLRLVGGVSAERLQRVMAQIDRLLVPPGE